jgi:hypothetical protein
MEDLLKFATEQNADQLYAVIEDDHFANPILGILRVRYNNGDLDDAGFCNEVLKYLGVKKNYVGILLIKEDWDDPTYNSSIKAFDETEAYEVFAESIGHTVESLEEGEENGEIVVKLIELYDVE